MVQKGKPLRIAILGLLVGLFLLGGLPILNSQSVKAAPYGSGCSISGLSEAGVGDGRLYNSTGNPNWDAGLTGEIHLAETGFMVHPNFGIIQDGNSPNAFAMPRVTNPNFPDGTVAFGINLLRNELGSTGTGCSTAAIVAHEYAHILQFKAGGVPQGKYSELHADFLAGWYIGNRGRWVPTNAFSSMFSFYQKGDYSFNSPGHHGTPDQRAAAFRAGVEAMNLHISQAYPLGIQIVTQNF
jgi:hypothetical protein